MFEKIDAIPWKVLILIGVVLLAIGLLVGIKFINFILVFAGFFLNCIFCSEFNLIVNGFLLVI